MAEENYTEIEETQFGTKTKHPAYGTLAFHRISGGETTLFGSSIQHRDIIGMELYHADLTRGLHNDHIYGREKIAEVEMSYSQFAEAITSMNAGTGVPVTIRWTEKDGRIPKCDFVNKREQFSNEFKEKANNAMSESQDLIREITDLFQQKKTLTKSDKEDIIKKLNRLSMDIGCNMDFISDMFNEQVDQTLTEAKGEIEAFAQNKINSIANNALVEHRDELLELKNPINLPD
jgi:hypothetical protein